jgi:hypothetical protein
MVKSTLQISAQSAGACLPKVLSGAAAKGPVKSSFLQLLEQAVHVSDPPVLD